MLIEIVIMKNLRRLFCGIDCRGVVVDQLLGVGFHAGHLLHYGNGMPLITLTTAAAQVGLSAEGLRRLIVNRPDIGRRIGGRWRIIPGPHLAQIRKENIT